MHVVWYDTCGTCKKNLMSTTVLYVSRTVPVTTHCKGCHAGSAKREDDPRNPRILDQHLLGVGAPNIAAQRSLCDLQQRFHVLPYQLHARWHCRQKTKVIGELKCT